jgi:hypothetical protein
MFNKVVVAIYLSSNYFLIHLEILAETKIKSITSEISGSHGGEYEDD